MEWQWHTWFFEGQVGPQNLSHSTCYKSCFFVILQMLTCGIFLSKWKTKNRL